MKHGEEPDTTLYWRGQTTNEPIYHIDYCFLPSIWMKRVKSVQLGSFSEWVASGLSDHVPLVVDVPLRAGGLLPPPVSEQAAKVIVASTHITVADTDWHDARHRCRVRRTGQRQRMPPS